MDVSRQGFNSPAVHDTANQQGWRVTNKGSEIAVKKIDLTKLADEANHWHKTAQGHIASAVEAAWHSGKALLKAKDGVKHGEWAGWLEANFNGSYRTAAKYMQLARNVPSTADLPEGSIDAALVSLKPKPVSKSRSTQDLIAEVQEWWKEAAKVFRENAANYQEVGRWVMSLRDEMTEREWDEALAESGPWHSAFANRALVDFPTEHLTHPVAVYEGIYAIIQIDETDQLMREVNWHGMDRLRWMWHQEGMDAEEYASLIGKPVGVIEASVKAWQRAIDSGEVNLAGQVHGDAAFGSEE